MPTRCNRWFLYSRSYCLLNMFQAPLCPSSVGILFPHINGDARSNLHQIHVSSQFKYNYGSGLYTQVT